MNEQECITQHSTLIPSISERLPVRDSQRMLIKLIREGLMLPLVITDEQINYQLSWCKWMVAEGHSLQYRTIEGVKDHLRQQFLSDEGVAEVIRAAEEKQNGKN